MLARNAVAVVPLDNRRVRSPTARGCVARIAGSFAAVATEFSCGANRFARTSLGERSFLPNLTD
jgi:hypothetical protein